METKLGLVAARLRVALDLHAAGVRLQRQNLRRRFPKADDAAVERMLTAWLRSRPGAEHGDVDAACSRVIEIP